MIDSQVKTLKITAVKINKTLAEGNKSMKKLRAEEQRLFRVQQTKVKIRKREDIVEKRKENKLGNFIKNRVIAPGLSFIDKLKDFFLLLGAGVLINALPGIISGVQKFLSDNEWIGKTLQSVIDVTGNLFMGLIDIFNFFSPKKEEMERQKEKLKKQLGALVGDTDAAEKELGETEKEVDKFVGDQLNERTPEQVRSDFISAVKTEGITSNSFDKNVTNFKNTREGTTKEYMGKTIVLPGIGSYKKYEDPGFLNLFPSVKEEATDTFGNQISAKELENRYNIVANDIGPIREQLQSEGVEGFSKGGTVTGSPYKSSSIKETSVLTRRRDRSIDSFQTFKDNVKKQSNIFDETVKSNDMLEGVVDNISKLASFDEKERLDEFIRVTTGGNSAQRPPQGSQQPQQGPQYRPPSVAQKNARNRRAVAFLGRPGLPQLPPTGTIPDNGMGQHYGDGRDDNGDGKIDRYHAGQDYDISGPDQLFYSRLGGVVTHAGNVGSGYGNVVDIYNKQYNVTERIAEAANILPGVKVGTNVAAGQAVVKGETNTGVIHYEIRKGKFNYGEAGSTGFNNTVDPVKFLENMNLLTNASNLHRAEQLSGQSSEENSPKIFVALAERTNTVLMGPV